MVLQLLGLHCCLSASDPAARPRLPPPLPACPPPCLLPPLPACPCRSLLAPASNVSAVMCTGVAQHTLNTVRVCAFMCIACACAHCNHLRSNIYTTRLKRRCNTMYVPVPPYTQYVCVCFSVCACTRVQFVCFACVCDLTMKIWCCNYLDYIVV